MKKKILLVFVSLITCVSITGCNFFFHPNQEQDTTEGQSTTEEEPAFSITIDYNVQTDSVDAANGTNLVNYTASFPELTITGGNPEAEQNINDYFSGLNFDFVHVIQPTISDATQDYQSNVGNPGFFWNPYEIEESFEMTRGDETCISFKQTDYYNTGGAHPGTMYKTVTFDTATGEVLSFTDILNYQVPDSFSVVTSYILDLMADPSYAGYFFDGYQTTVKDLDLADRWYFSEDGFVVIYNEYEVAPYAAGYFEFTIPYSDCTFLLDKYK